MIRWAKRALLATLGGLAMATGGCVDSFVTREQAGAWPPWPQEPAPTAEIAPGTGLADRALAAYQRHLRRPAREDAYGCRFEPSCSVYARNSVQAHGMMVGILRTISRLFWREPFDAPDGYQPLMARGAMHVYDPSR